MAGGSDKNSVLEGPTVWQKNFNFAFSGPTARPVIHCNAL